MAQSWAIGPGPGEVSMSRSEALTRGIRVQVQSQYLPERSSPEASRWLFVYRVRIANEGDENVQLLSRRWEITDARGRVEVVEGPGVVGKQPLLRPGEEFEYVSSCPLGTSFGVMHGTYQMACADGRRFDVEIAPFALGQPATLH
jgi:ApaG protein